MFSRFAPIVTIGIVALMLILIGRLPPAWGAAMVACLCATASLALGWMIHRSPPSRLPGPVLLVLTAFCCLVWGLVLAHTLRALLAPEPAAPERVLARKVGAVSVFVLVSTIAFMILRGEFKGYRARRRTGR